MRTTFPQKYILTRAGGRAEVPSTPGGAKAYVRRVPLWDDIGDTYGTLRGISWSYEVVVA
jgi:hypothetical protein